MSQVDDEAEGTWIPTYCYQCNSGPDLLRVKRIDGVAVKVDGNPAFADCHPADARICLKAYSLIQKTYNPHRVRAPLKRTNARKGRDEDPRFVEISWDEALDLVAERLRRVRQKGLLNAAGTPRLALTIGAGGTPPAYYGTMDAFMTAWGPFDRAFGSGGGMRCWHSEHLHGEMWHRAFTCCADVPRCDYVIAFANNSNAGSGVVGIRRHADARVRGMRRVQIEPLLSVTAATADEWIPILPKTDAALLFAMIHVVLHELQTWDNEFLRKMTNSPYLVGPDGNYVRDKAAGKPLVWDVLEARAIPFDAKEAADFALVGSFNVNGVVAKPSFELLRQHVLACTPEWAAAITSVEAKTIRRLAREYVNHARIGATIEIDGVKLPLRPVNIYLGRGVNNGPGAYQAVWAAHVLQVLVGALEVPGGHLGTYVQLSGPISGTADGLIDFPFHPTDAQKWPWPPETRDAWTSITPLIGPWHRNQTFGAHHLAWLNLRQQQENWPESEPPDVWFIHRANPAVSQADTELILEGMAKIPFQVSFAYTLDETTDFADVVLPESGDLESLQIFRIGGVHHTENFWDKVGVAVRQPVVEPVFNTRDISDVFTELAEKVGLLAEYNGAINMGAVLGFPLKTPMCDYHLDPDSKYSATEIFDRMCKAATMVFTRGEQEHDLEWYKENGAFLVPFPKLDGIVLGPTFLRPWYLHALMAKRGLRYQLPYQEQLKRIGEDLTERLHAVSVHWWDRQLREYQALPDWRDFPSLWDRGPQYDLWLVPCRSMQFTWGANVGVPYLIEAAQMVLGHNGFVINVDTGRKRKIKDGDEVWVESPMGKVKGRAVLREGVHPDVILTTHQFGHWRMPVAKDLGWPNMNPLLPLNYDLTDETGSLSDHVKVSLRKA